MKASLNNSLEICIPLKCFFFFFKLDRLTNTKQKHVDISPKLESVQGTDPEPASPPQRTGFK